MIIFLLVGLLLGALVVIFALQNLATVSVAFFAWHFEGSLALIIVIAVICGILISWLLSLPDFIRRRFQISKLKDTNTQLKDELIQKEGEVESEKSKLAANNAYLDDLKNKPKI